MKKILFLIVIITVFSACRNTQSYQIKDFGIQSENSYNLEELENKKKSLEEIFIFNEKGVSIRKDGKNLVLSMPELILFDFNKYEIKDGIKNSLNTLARALKTNKDIRIKIDGYTDFIGSEGYNLELSVKRARAIKNYLVSKGAIENNISIEGYGEQNPVSSNNTESGRARNRRVEFIISRG